MKVVLNERVLVKILEDGEREMLARFNITKNEKKRKKESWLPLMEAVKVYRSQLEDSLLPVIIEDFLGPVDVQFGGLDMELVEKEKLMKFMKMVECSDTDKYRKGLIESVESLKNFELVEKKF